MCSDWYDFLTQPEDLDRTLPSLTRQQCLIYLRQFLSHADHADAQILRHKNEENAEVHQQSKKSTFLDIFALKMASHLRWNLALLGDTIALPLFLQTRLFRLLLRTTAEVPGLDPYQDVDWPGWKPVSSFAHVTYHRWCLQIGLQNSLVSKPSNFNTPPVPGLSDIPDVVFITGNQQELEQLLSRLDTSVTLLERLSTSDIEFKRPTAACFHLPDLRSDLLDHDWSVAEPITANEMKCALAFSLGRWRLQRIEISQAKELFSIAETLIDNMENPPQVELGISCELLTAYTTACDSCLTEPESTRGCLRQQVEQCIVSGDYQPTPSLLMTDLLECISGRAAGPRVDLEMRERVEREAGKVAGKGNPMDKELHFQITTCNILERVFSGHAILSGYLSLLENQIANACTTACTAINFLLAQMAACLATCPPLALHQHMNFHCFLWFLCQSLPAELSFVSTLLDSDVACHLSDEEMTALRDWSTGLDLPGSEDALDCLEDLEAEGRAAVDDVDHWFDDEDWDEEPTGSSASSGGGKDQTGLGQRSDTGTSLASGISSTSSMSGGGGGSWGVGRGGDSSRLLTSYDPEEIHALVIRLGRGSAWNRHALINLSDRWRVPGPLAKLLNTTQTTLDQVFAYILIAKSQILKAMEDWKNSRLLLYAAETALKDSYRLNKMIKNEITLIDIQEFLVSGGKNSTTSPTDLIARCKTCITQLRLDGDCPPTDDVLIACTCLLIASKEWDYLIMSTSGYSGPSELGRLLVSVSRETPTVARGGTKQLLSAGKDLWDYLCRCLLPRRSQTGQMMSGSGGVLPRGQLLEFVRLLQSAQELDILIAALIHMTSLLRSDVTLCNPHSSYSDIWPSNLPPNAQIHTMSVCEAVRTMLETGLRLESQRVGWLVLRGDLAAADQQYTMALRSYLEAGGAASQFFSYCVPPDVYSDRVIQQMIKCCQELRLHGEAMVLCQMIGQINSATQLAREVSDSGDTIDAFLGFVWDINLLEILTAIETRRGALAKRAKLINMIGQPDINTSNRGDILLASEIRKKSEFFRVLAEHHLT